MAIFNDHWSLYANPGMKSQLGLLFNQVFIITYFCSLLDQRSVRKQNKLFNVAWHCLPVQGLVKIHPMISSQLHQIRQQICFHLQGLSHQKRIYGGFLHEFPNCPVYFYTYCTDYRCTTENGSVTTPSVNRF